MALNIKSPKFKRLVDDVLNGYVCFHEAKHSAYCEIVAKDCRKSLDKLIKYLEQRNGH